MKVAFTILIGFHSIIHLLGFVKGFQLAEINELTLPISRKAGLIWLASFLLFAITFWMYFINSDYWWLAAFIAVLFSQILLISFWQDAKYGSVPNLIVFIIAIFGFFNWNFENGFRKDVKIALTKTSFNNNVITKSDLSHLPLSVQNYLNYVGVVGKPKVDNFQLFFEGEMRNKNQEWFSFTSEQYNFFDNPSRLFFMKAKVNRLPTVGYHAYKDDKALMLIKLLSVFPVVNIFNQELFKAETVTYFNDLCLFAPSKLIDKKILWEPLDDFSTKAFFHNNEITISAILQFNNQGQLINFISDDRQDINYKKPIRFSTPVSNYKKINGINLPTYGEAIWHYPEGEFVYGKLNLKKLEYNLTKD